MSCSPQVNWCFASRDSCQARTQRPRERGLNTLITIPINFAPSRKNGFVFLRILCKVALWPQLVVKFLRQNPASAAACLGINTVDCLRDYD